MARLIEQYLPPVQEDGIVTNKALRVLNATGLVAGGNATPILSAGTSLVPNVYTGSGAPTITAPQGSLYLRSDGSSVSTRLYVNTNGATTWTAVTTAA